MKRYLLITLFFSYSYAAASGVRVGNGNDGRDLENLSLVKAGILIETQKLALEKLQAVQTDQIEYLGNLTQELATSEIYLSSVAAKNYGTEVHQIDGQMDDTIYARTFAEPGAATRFFPQALMLSPQQLVALHIHEALHRALPFGVNKNETVVAQITRAIVDPNATPEKIKLIANDTIKEGIAIVKHDKSVANPASSYSLRTVKQSLHKTPHFGGSSLRFSKTYFTDSKISESQFQSMDMVSIRYGDEISDTQLLVAGLDFTQIKTDQMSAVGPLRFVGDLQFAAESDLNLRLGLRSTMNSMSTEEVKTTPIGRDSTTVVGTASFVRDNSVFIEADLALTSGSNKKQKIGNVEYNFEYGNMRTIGLNFGWFNKSLETSLRGELQVMDNYKVSGGAFATETGPLRVLKFGPSLLYRYQNFELSAQYLPISGATKDLSLEWMGDVFGAGANQGGMTMGVGYVF